ncbi:MAG: alpha-amylase family glycosyl hydrolase [Chloroherpetonaceae bacterium]|nr:alpha-amylase family glycosyl hydrolase [Chloroherpetonaceae bacterium]MDW8438764.1 alpha-amylase family glycosyl hydrolase [Chloroherpetonaceae bacterium]
MRLFFALTILALALIGAFLFFLRGYARTPKPMGNAAANPSPDWIKSAVIYEVFLRNFSSDGTFKAAEERLESLKQLGATVVWLMPIHPIGKLKRKGSLGSPYSVKDYFDVNSEHGTKEDFKRFVHAAHALELKVVMDFVGNHTAWDCPLVQERPDFYAKDKKGNIVSPNDQWTDVAQLDYKNPDVRAYFANALKTWVKEFDVDGFRCDVAEAIPSDFWQATIAELRQIKPDLLMLAESTLPEHHVVGFDLTYSWNVHGALLDIVKGKKPAHYLDEVLENEEKVFAKHSLRLRFNSNHDLALEHGPPVEAFGGSDGAKATATLVFTMGGYGTIRSVPLLYNGDDIGYSKRISLFEKDPIDWNAPRAEEFRTFYRNLIWLRKTHPALVHGAMEKVKSSNDEAIYAFIRSTAEDKVLVVVNLRNAPFTGYLRLEPNQTLYDFFESERQFATKDGNLKLALNPFEFKCLVFKP